MAVSGASSSLFNLFHSRLITGWSPTRKLGEKEKFGIFVSNIPTSASSRPCQQALHSTLCRSAEIAHSPHIHLSLSDARIPGNLHTTLGVMRNVKLEGSTALGTSSHITHRFILADLDPGRAKIVIGIIGPFLSAFGFLFILRIVMSWYPKLPVGKFPFIIAYAPTEPLLVPTRKLIPPLGGVDITPVVWFGLLSFLNEILVGPQGLLVLLSQQVN